MSISIIGVVFVCVGLVVLVSGPWRFLSGPEKPDLLAHDVLDLALVELSGAIAVLGGALVLRGRHWGRWLLVFWTAAHVVLSLAHDRLELAVHAALFVVVVWLLYRRAASTYFGRVY